MTNNDTVYLTSDLHLGHEFVASLRGFPNAQEHDETILNNWRETIPPTAHVWVLGDVILPNLRHNLDRLNELPGIKHLITGNHDKAHPSHRDADKYRNLTGPNSYFPTFTSIQEFARRKINDQSVLLSHFPYAKGENSDHTLEPRFTQYRLRNEGLTLLHGHTHSKNIISYTDNHGTLQIHVGLDAWDLKPVSLSQVTALIPSPLTSPQRQSVWPENSPLPLVSGNLDPYHRL